MANDTTMKILDGTGATQNVEVDTDSLSNVTPHSVPLLRGSVAQTTVSVLASVWTQVVTANDARRLLLVQNQDASNPVALVSGANAPTGAPSVNPYWAITANTGTANVFPPPGTGAFVSTDAWWAQTVTPGLTATLAVITG